MTRETSVLPLVSVVIPTRNEENHIGQCLQSVISQDYPAEKLEILVVDGLSEDGSREMVAALAARHPHIRLLDNPRRTAPAALNLSIRETRGEIIVRVDAHTVLEPDYVRQCVDYLGRTGADNVGGLMRMVGQGYVGEAIALALSSRFGVGDSKFHYTHREEYVDTVYLGAWPREVFNRVGLFNEDLVRNQDYELNYRLRAAGGKILCTPAIKSYYYGRSSLSALGKQYFDYGFWKLEMIQRHPRSILLRHLVAPVFVFTLIVGSLLALVDYRLAWLFALVLFSYLASSLVFSTYLAWRKGWRYLPALPVVFACMHVAWGMGFLWKLVTLSLRDKLRL